LGTNGEVRGEPTQNAPRSHKIQADSTAWVIDNRLVAMGVFRLISRVKMKIYAQSGRLGVRPNRNLHKP
jgi:hypothetical protein